MKTIVGAVIDSVKNLKDVVVLTLFSLSVFSLLGLQIYMGILSQKCILNGPQDMSDEQWLDWNSNSTHWIPEPEAEIFGSYRLCGNATGAQSCPDTHTCLQGFGPNPDYGFTNFDTFGWALICSFRLMTQDFWEGLYMQVLKTAGSWHIIFFIVSIFLGSIYLMNLILAIVAMSYNELQRRAELEDEAAAEDEAAFLESCRLLESQRAQQQLDQSQFGSQLDSPEAGTSYRPSVEIGLAGQSLLASLCQNGLLGQHVREKLESQHSAALPGVDFLGFGAGDWHSAAGQNHALRSHSLSVNIDCNQQQAQAQHRNSVNKLWPAQANDQQPRSQALRMSKAQLFDSSARAKSQFLGHELADQCQHTIAASMTELRRKSSVRTLDGRSSPSRSQTGSLVGQRRLLPNIGLDGHRLDKCLSSSASRRSSRAPPIFQQQQQQMRNQQQQQKLRQEQAARSNFGSEYELELLRQRAAMIRIVSDDCGMVNNQVGCSIERTSHSPQQLSGKP